MNLHRFPALIAPMLLAGLLAGCLPPFDAMSASATDDGGAGPVDAQGMQVVIGPPTPDAGGDGSGAQSGRDLFDATVKPMMDQRCSPCHGMVGGLGPPFMKPDAYDSLVAYPGIVTRDPTHSLLITKGPHNGAVYFNDNEKLTVIAWLAVEAAAVAPGASGIVETPPQPISQGANTVPLDPLGKDFLGASITFDATRLGAALKVQSLTVHATGPSGLHIVHPLFIGVRNGVKTPDPVDNFDGYDITIPNAMSTSLGPGLLLLTNIGFNDQLSIAFQSITRFDGIKQLGGCKSVGGFTQFAKPAIASAGCASMCHGGTNATAQNALDMSRLGDMTNDGQSAVCAQVLNRVNKVNPDQSQLFYVNAFGSMANHPFKFPDQGSTTTFQMAVSQWIVQEK